MVSDYTEVPSLKVLVELLQSKYDGKSLFLVLGIILFAGCQGSRGESYWPLTPIRQDVADDCAKSI